MVSLNYISNLNVDQDGGGWNGMNKNVYQQLKKFAAINLIDAINPKISLFESGVSKIKRSAGFKAKFPAFSLKRLGRIAELVNDKLAGDARLNFFHGATPWLLVKSTLPYACYLDASFATYLSIYHRENDFDV